MLDLADIQAEIKTLERRLKRLRAQETRALAGTSGSPSRWHGAALERLRAEYESGRVLRAIAKDFRTSAGCICNLAYRYNWTRKLVAHRAMAALARREGAGLA